MNDNWTILGLVGTALMCIWAGISLFSKVLDMLRDKRKVDVVDSKIKDGKDTDLSDGTSVIHGQQQTIDKMITQLIGAQIEGVKELRKIDVRFANIESMQGEQKKYVEEKMSHLDFQCEEMRKQIDLLKSEIHDITLQNEQIIKTLTKKGN